MKTWNRCLLILALIALALDVFFFAWSLLSIGEGLDFPGLGWIMAGSLISGGTILYFLNTEENELW